MPDADGVITDDEQAQLIANGPELCEIYRRYRGVMLNAPNAAEEWNRWAMAILDRCHHTLETILKIAEREVDAAILTRSLYEHVVAFAWVAIDPQRHLLRLEAWENLQLEKMLADLRHVGGPDDPTANEVLALRRTIAVAGNVAAAPETPDRALAADAHWKAHFRGLTSLRRTYANLFRFYSAFVHPTGIGLASFRTPPPPEEHSGEPAAGAVMVFCSGLLVASAVLGWPDREEVMKAFTRGFSVK